MKILKWIQLVMVMVFAEYLNAQNQMEVVISGVKDDSGTIIVGLFSDEESFLKKPIIGKTVKATQGKVIVVLEGIPEGTYGLSIIHDSNSNGALDSNFFGIPKEGFGFSNDAMGTFGPPSFEKAKLVISNMTIINVVMRYM